MAGRAPGLRPVPPPGGPEGPAGPRSPPPPPPEGGGAPQSREEEEQRQGPAATPIPLAPPAGAPPTPVAPRPRRGRGGGGGGRRLGGDAAGLVHERLPHRLLHGAPGGSGRGCPAASEAVLPEEEIPPEIGGRIRPPAPCRCQRPFRGPSPSPTDSGIPAPQILMAKRRERSSLHPGGFLSTALPGGCPHGSVPPVHPLPNLLGDKTACGGGPCASHTQPPAPGGGQDALAAAVFAQGIGCGADVHPTAPTGPGGRRHRGRVPPRPVPS